MINLCSKFEVSIATGYEDRKCDAKSRQELIRKWDSERELLRSAPGSYPNSLK